MLSRSLHERHKSSRRLNVSFTGQAQLFDSSSQSQHRTITTTGQIQKIVGFAESGFAHELALPFFARAKKVPRISLEEHIFFMGKTAQRHLVSISFNNSGSLGTTTSRSILPK